MQIILEEISKKLRKWEKVSSRTLNNGTILLCHVSHVASQAWLHEIHAPLVEKDIKDLETKMGKTFPKDYFELLKNANGINIFSDSLSIWGKKTSYSRDIDESRQPYDLIDLNEEIEDEIPKEWFIFGSYSWDGSLMAYNMKESADKVFRCSRDDYEIFQEWPNLLSWLNSEVDRLSNLFDENGVEYNEDTPTVP